MRTLILKILIGLPFITLLHRSCTETQKLCEESLDQAQLLVINCSHRGDALKDIPKGYNDSVAVIDVSYNTIEQVTKKSLMKYPNLVKLYMVKMKRFINEKYPGANKPEVFETDAFTGLLKLEYLDISETFYSEYYYKLLIWPPNLKVLKFNNNDGMNFKVNYLEHLEEFYANNCGLVDIPDFHLEAPLKIIDLFDNPIIIINVSYIAPYCQLQRFGLSFPDKKYFHMTTTYCECMKVKRWLARFAIWSYPLNCTSPPEETSECQSWFFPEELKLRQKCVARVVDIKYLTTRFYIIVGCIVAAVILLTLVALVVYEIRRREKLQEELMGKTLQEGAEEQLEDEMETIS